MAHPCRRTNCRTRRPAPGADRRKRRTGHGEWVRTPARDRGCSRPRPARNGLGGPSPPSFSRAPRSPWPWPGNGCHRQPQTAWAAFLPAPHSVPQTPAADPARTVHRSPCRWPPHRRRSQRHVRRRASDRFRIASAASRAQRRWVRSPSARDRRSARGCAAARARRRCAPRCAGPGARRSCLPWGGSGWRNRGRTRSARDRAPASARVACHGPRCARRRWRRRDHAAVRRRGNAASSPGCAGCVPGRRPIRGKPREMSGAGSTARRRPPAPRCASTPARTCTGRRRRRPTSTGRCQDVAGRFAAAENQSERP